MSIDWGRLAIPTMHQEKLSPEKGEIGFKITKVAFAHIPSGKPFFFLFFYKKGYFIMYVNGNMLEKNLSYIISRSQTPKMDQQVDLSSSTKP